MDKEKTENKEKYKPVLQSSNVFPPVSKIIFDEKTGTVTLKLASEEEIIEAERMKKLKDEE